MLLRVFEMKVSFKDKNNIANSSLYLTFILQHGNFAGKLTTFTDQGIPFAKKK
jgi:hypothetical protein